MRLQFLGDSRDAFKWDFLHWFCTESNPSYRSLTVVPMLNPDDPNITHGRTNPEAFNCREKILSFLQTLREEPRDIMCLKHLGEIEDLGSFEVDLYEPETLIGFDWARAYYWENLKRKPPKDSIVFLDPDTGFETKTQSSEKHLRFGEALDILNQLDEQSCLVVFQYRPQGQRWEDVVKRLSDGAHLPFFKVVFYKETGLVLLARYKSIKERFDEALTTYKGTHPDIQIC